MEQGGALNPSLFTLRRIAYSIKEDRNDMATWNSRGLRGSTLEDLINRTNEKYLESNLALIQKIPTPITPIEIDKKSRHITLAYFDMKSTVDSDYTYKDGAGNQTHYTGLFRAEEYG